MITNLRFLRTLNRPLRKSFNPKKRIQIINECLFADDFLPSVNTVVSTDVPVLVSL